MIDDEQSIRNLLDARYEVVLADSGRKALDLFRRARPDVVVLDLKMPELDGITVLQQVRSLIPDQPVIMLTGPERQRRNTRYTR